jgi:hypothetical protein
MLVASTRMTVYKENLTRSKAKMDVSLFTEQNETTCNELAWPAPVETRLQVFLRDPCAIVATVNGPQSAALR